jgi:hypothetical protein
MKILRRNETAEDQGGAANNTPEVTTVPAPTPGTPAGDALPAGDVAGSITPSVIPGEETTPKSKSPEIEEEEEEVEEEFEGEGLIADFIVDEVAGNGAHEESKKGFTVVLKPLDTPANARAFKSMPPVLHIGVLVPEVAAQFKKGMKVKFGFVADND